MSGDSANEEIDKIFSDAAEAHEKFVSESKEIDAAWATGKLDEWIAEKLKQVKKGYGYKDDDNSGPDVSGGDPSTSPA